MPYKILLSRKVGSWTSVLAIFVQTFPHCAALAGRRRVLCELHYIFVCRIQGFEALVGDFVMARNFILVRYTVVVSRRLLMLRFCATMCKKLVESGEQF